jgi:hypothetical protein
MALVTDTYTKTAFYTKDTSTGMETADLSTPLRSGRDDKFVAMQALLSHGKSFPTS